jgi:2-polyprenyl-3-methyl-5-hydroxy-6-metoxy-1,4-benzoquinol methylase
MNQAYAEAYPLLYEQHWWWRSRERILVEKIETLLGGRAHARILDVGCGAGLFFGALARFGDVEGIETDEESVSRSGPWRPRITVGELDERFRPEAPYDLITMLDVIEHVDDPGVMLRRAGELLAVDGNVLITVPAFNWLWTAHDVLNDHRTRFTRTELQKRITEAGLHVSESQYLFQSLIVPKLAARVREYVAGGGLAVPEVPSGLLNHALQSWFRVEHLLFGWVPFGTSVLAVAKSH